MPDNKPFPPFTVKRINDEVVIVFFHQAKLSCCLCLSLEDSEELAEELLAANEEVRTYLRPLEPPDMTGE